MAEQFNLSLTGEEVEKVLTDSKTLTEAKSPSLSEISGFICVNKEGNAIGMMSKEQVAQVVGELIGIAGLTQDGLMPARCPRIRPTDNKVVVLKMNPFQYFPNAFRVSMSSNTAYGIFDIFIRGSVETGRNGDVIVTGICGYSLKVYKDINSDNIYITTSVESTTLNLDFFGMWSIAELSYIEFEEFESIKSSLQEAIYRNLATR